MTGMSGLKRTVIVALAGFAAACGNSEGPPVRVSVPAGASMRTAADSLAKASVINSARLFRFYASIKGNDRDIKPGTYLLPRSSSYGSVLEDLRAGKGLVHIVTIPEGFSLSQIVPLLTTKLDVPVDSVEAAVRDSALLHHFDLSTSTVEGYVFPDTYIFPAGTTAHSAVNTMAHRFDQI